MCPLPVLSRAIARDLFDGRRWRRRWRRSRSPLRPLRDFLRCSAVRLTIFSAAFRIRLCGGFRNLRRSGVRDVRRRNQAAADNSLHPFSVAGSYLALFRDARFVAPARTASLLMAGLFAVFWARRACCSRASGSRRSCSVGCLPALSCWFSPPGILAPKLSARLGAYHATLIGLGLAAVGNVFAAGSPGPGREEFAAAVSRHGFDLRDWGGNCDPAVECGCAIAIRRQGGPSRQLYSASRKWRGPPAARRSQRSCSAIRPSGLEPCWR